MWPVLQLRRLAAQTGPGLEVFRTMGSAEIHVVPQWLSQRLECDGDRLAIRFHEGGQTQQKTWREVVEAACRAAQVLQAAGVRPGDRVVQVSENRYEWIIADLAIQLAQAIHVPVHAPLTGPQIAYQIRDSGAQVVLISTPQQAAKLASASDLLPTGLQLLSFEACDLGGRHVALWSDAQTQVGGVDTRDVLRAAVDNLTENSLATILYTSGTTGEPKGVMLTQRNLTTNVMGAIAAFGMSSEDVRLTFLPLSHIFARTCDLYTWLAIGSQLALAESRDTVVADCAVVRPTILNGVPYFFDKLRRALCDHGRGQEPGALRGLLGNAIRQCCSGGAALPDHVFDFFWQQDVPLFQGYGLTETSPVISLSTPTHYRRSASGRAIPGVEIRIADDGEILTRGPHVMAGYYKNQRATDDVLRNGWFHTGDLGRLDEDGFLYITGRKKEILVTSGGKNIAPVYLETLLTEDPLISQALIVGDGKNYLTALIVPDLENLRGELAARGLALPSQTELETVPVRELYEQRIGARLSGVSHYEQVRNFTLLRRSFSIEEGELTPKLSLRRDVISQHFASQIAAMYRKD